MTPTKATIRSPHRKGEGLGLGCGRGKNLQQNSLDEEAPCLANLFTTWLFDLVIRGAFHTSRKDNKVMNSSIQFSSSLFSLKIPQEQQPNPFSTCKLLAPNKDASIKYSKLNPAACLEKALTSLPNDL